MGEELKEGDVIWIQATVIWEYKEKGIYDIEFAGGNTYVMDVNNEQLKIKRDETGETNNDGPKA